jgi:hypothetical protein
LSAGVEALGHYLLAVTDPWNPDIQIGRLIAESWFHVALGVALIAGLCFLVPRFVRRGLHELELAGLVLVGVGFGLVLHFVPLAVNVVAADRFMYVPLAGLALATTRSVSDQLARVRPAYVLLGASLLVSSFGVATWRRAFDWADEIQFWTRAHREKQVNNGTAAVELGNVFFRAGLHAHALGVYHSYNDVDQFNRAMVGNNMATALLAMGHYKPANAVLRQIVGWFPQIPKFRLNLAFSWMSLDDFAAARRELDQALRLYPDHPLALQVKANLPVLEASRGQPYGDTLKEALLRAKYAIETTRTYHAFRFMEQALAKGPVPTGEAEGMLFFALKFADPPTTERIFQGYVAAYAGKPPPAVVEAHRLRKESGRRLLAVWPSLGIKVPKF